MSYKTILVHADHDNRCAVRVEAAIHLAKQHDAHLTALYAHAPFVLPGYLMQVEKEIGAVQQKKSAESMARARASFNNLVSSMGFNNAEWLPMVKSPVDALTMQARYADLVVVGQKNPSEDSNMAKGIPAQLVLAICRPVLMVPYTGSFLSIGHRVLVAWNESREAARAITDALPLLKRADSVTLMALSRKHGAHGDIVVTDIVQYLGRHGIKVEVLSDHAADVDVGNVLLSRAADLSADLLIMGGYGHSRLREWVLGGATRTILDTMTIPVLMSH